MLRNDFICPREDHKNVYSDPPFDRCPVILTELSTTRKTKRNEGKEMKITQHCNLPLKKKEESN